MIEASGSKRIHPLSRRSGVLFACAAAGIGVGLCTAGTAAASTRTFTGGGPTVNWSEPANWAGGIVPSAGDALVLQATGTNNLPAGTEFASITFTLSSNVTINGSAMKITDGMTLTGGGNPQINNALELLGTSQTILVDNASNRLFTLAGEVSGTSAITKTGPGILRFFRTGDNTFTGGIVVEQGIIESRNSRGGYSFGSGLITLQTTATTAGILQMGTGSSSVSIAGLAGSGTVRNSSNQALTLTIGGSHSLSASFSGTITDGTSTDILNLTKSGTGTQALLGSANTYTGVTTIDGGALEVATLAAGGSASSLGSATAAAANLVINGGALRHVGGAASSDRNFTTGTAGATIEASGGGALTLSGTSAFSTADQAVSLTLGGTSTALNTFAGVIGNNGSGNVSLVKSGLGTWVLDGANAYGGSTTVNAGLLVVNGDQSAAAGAVSVAAGAALGGTGTLGGSATVNGSIRPGNSIGTLRVDGAVTWNAGDAWVFELGTAAASLAAAGSGSSTQDLLDIGGNFQAGTGSTWSFDFAGTGAIGWYKLVDWTGSTTFATGTSTQFTAANLAEGLTVDGFVVDATTSALYVSVAAVPEPDAVVLLTIAGAVLAGAGVRRRP